MKTAQFLPLLTAVLITSLQAGVVPGRWDKVDNLALPVDVIVMLKEGERVEGSLTNRTVESLLIQTSSAYSQTVQRGMVRRVMKAERVPDSTRNGTFIGSGVGFGIGFGTTVALERSVTASGFRLAEENLSLAILGGLIGAGAGAVTGWAIDHYEPSHETLYKSR